MPHIGERSDAVLRTAMRGHTRCMAVDLPPILRSALDKLAHGKSQREFAHRAEVISQRYRAGAGSHDTIKDADDALAYAFTRLPATYAATAAVIAAVREAWPDFSPRSLVDVGA